MLKKNKTPVNVPLLTDLVAPGDPRKKVHSDHKASQSTHLKALNQHIDDIENAIGQKETNPMGRAFAIRKEEMSKKVN